jgi:hypothetical protein
VKFDQNFQTQILVQKTGIYFYDKRRVVICGWWLVLSATPLKSLGIKFRRESHNINIENFKNFVKG